jgi:hypothetical protein
MALDLRLASPADVMGSTQTTLVDLVDGLIAHGVVLRAELWLTVADIDLVFIGLDLLITSPQKMHADRSPS